MTQTIYQVDSFTAVPFKGNPAGVCLLAASAEEAWMQSVAMEMNLSETAFLVPQGEGYHLRWFTPRKEVSLCGHATLASAHVLWESGALAPSQTARFETLSGTLTARKDGDWIEMDFPARIETREYPPADLFAALGATPIYVGKSNNTFLCELESEEQVRALTPDFNALVGLPMRSVCVTALADDPAFDFVSRYFAPKMGVNEDPVTGSAHCILTPFWAARLGKTELRAYQASARGGELRVCLAGDRVLIRGQAVTVMVGELK